MTEMAIHGGVPTLSGPLAPYRTIGKEEAAAVARVMESGTLSGFVGAWCPEFNGGPEVQAFEQEWAEAFGVRHAVTVNSNTSGLIAALGAVGVSPGDEVIVPPYTMSATAVGPLIYGGIPVFVDIERNTFCLDVDKVRKAITDKTRAVVAVDLFGHPAELTQLRSLCDEHGIYLIEDVAQAPFAVENNRFAGTVGHIGVFSLNYHKHFHTGEGGVCVTDDSDLAIRLQAIRNHGENVVDPLEMRDITNIVGFNFRMTELSAAIGREQLKKGRAFVDRRVELADRLSDALRDLPGLTPPMVRPGCRHVYYVWAMRYDAEIVGVPRDRFCAALAAEGFPMWQGYVVPLYHLPLFRERKAIGRDGFPFTLTDRTYPVGLCPVAEHMHNAELLEFPICSFEISDEECDKLAEAVRKVYAARGSL